MESRRCSDSTTLERCADEDDDGCFEWIYSETCEADQWCVEDECVDDGCTGCGMVGPSCLNVFTETLCVEDSDGCSAHFPTPCGENEFCVGDHCEEVCTDSCDEEGQTRCINTDEAWVCQNRYSVCLNWNPVDRCPVGMSCARGVCSYD